MRRCTRQDGPTSGVLGLIVRPAPLPPARSSSVRTVAIVATVIALLGLSILGYGFFYLAHEVGEGSTAALDRRILLSLRNPADLSDPR